MLTLKLFCVYKIPCYAKDMDEKRKRGRPTTDPAQAIHLRIPASVLAAIDAAAKDAGLNRTQWLVRLVRSHLGG